MRRVGLLVLLFCLAPLALYAGEPSAKPETGIEFPFKNGDNVFWIGSSSTRIGQWCRTLEFLLRTRHPEIKLTFDKQTTGAGTFETALEDLPYWLKLKPTLVFFNYGGNDAIASKRGVNAFKAAMGKCVEQSVAAGARVVLMPPQGGDVRVCGREGVVARKLYAKVMADHCAENGWSFIDTCTKLEAMQQGAQADNAMYTMNKDVIHLTDSAYIAWGYFLYEGMNPPVIETSAEIAATGRLVGIKNCKITDIIKGHNRLSFTRVDQVLPLLPPNPVPETVTSKPEPHFLPARPPPQMEYADEHGQKLPPRKHAPMEEFSRYMLKITGLEAGDYEILCNDKPLGTTTAAALGEGVNLNSVLLDSKKPAPWLELVTEIWNGKSLEKIGKTKFSFTVKKAQ
jgi:hypothetical protein